MKPFMIKYDFSKLAAGKLFDSVIMHGEVTVFAGTKEEAIALATGHGYLPQFVLDHPSCMDTWGTVK